MSSVDDAYKTPTVAMKDDNWQQYVILEDHDMELKDIIAEYDQFENGKPDGDGNKR